MPVKVENNGGFKELTWRRKVAYTDGDDYGDENLQLDYDVDGGLTKIDLTIDYTNFDSAKVKAMLASLTRSSEYLHHHRLQNIGPDGKADNNVGVFVSEVDGEVSITVLNNNPGYYTNNFKNLTAILRLIGQALEISEDDMGQLITRARAFDNQGLMRTP